MEIAKDKLAAIALFLTSYAIFVSLLYHLTFWSKFGINIFQYMPISELLISSVHPLIISVFPFLAGGLIPTALSSPSSEGKGRDTKVGIFLNKHIVACTAMYIFVALLPLLTEIRYRHIFTAAMLIPVVDVVISRYQLLTNVISNAKARLIITYALAALPVAATAYGAYSAMLIVNNEEFLVAKLSNIEGKYKYIGNVGGYLFTTSFDNREIQITRFAENNSVALSNIDNSTIPSR